MEKSAELENSSLGFLLSTLILVLQSVSTFLQLFNSTLKVEEFVIEFDLDFG